MKSNILNSVTILKDLSFSDFEGFLYGANTSEGLPTIQDIPMGSVQRVLSYLKPLIVVSENRFVVCQGSEKSLVLIGNSSNGTCGSWAVSASTNLNVQSVLGFVSYLTEVVDLAGRPASVTTNSHFFLQVRDSNKIFRSIISIDNVGEKPYYANSGELFPFEDQSDYVGLEKGNPPPIEVLWKFANAYGWSSPRTKEFWKQVQKCTLVSFPIRRTITREIRIREDIEDAILRIPEELKSL